MKNSIKLSIITPVFNNKKTIGRTIESVINQNYDNYEYIIIDGASTDGTLDIIKGYMEKYDKIKLVSEKDTGIYNAMNKGIKMATGDLIGIINSDDYYEINAFNNILNNYNEYEYQVIYGMLRKILNGKEYSIYCNNYQYLKHNMITHPTCFISKKIYEKYGLYDEKYRLAADYDYMIKLSMIDEVKFVQINSIIANYSMGGASGTQESDLEALKIRKKYGFISKKGYFIRKIKIKLMKIFHGNNKY